MTEGLLKAFWAYERALMADDLAAMDYLFAPGTCTLRGDTAGLLVGHDEIAAYRRARGGAPARDILDVRVIPAGAEHALVVAVTAAHRGGRGLQTQLWRREHHGDADRWLVVAAHVAPPPSTFDSAVWRVVGDPLVPATGTGALDGESVAVKDVFAVAGSAVGGGVPDFLSERDVETGHATALRRLLDAGASLRGIARTDQFAYSLAGSNEHYGAPVNAVVPGALPGGSTSGPATAVALGAASIGLGTDTAGSIRVPASYQGLWGLRTTHGAVPREGMLPLAPDFDTVGLLTRTADLLARAASALLGAHTPADLPLDLTGQVKITEIADELGDLAAVSAAFSVHQGWQAWQAHGAWLEAHPGSVLGAPAERFAWAAGVTEEQDRRAQNVLHAAREHWDSLLGDDVLVLPSAGSAAPRVWADPSTVQAAREATLQLTCIAGVTGRPAVSAPLGTDSDGAPIGTCFVGPRGSDLQLVHRAFQTSRTADA